MADFLDLENADEYLLEDGTSFYLLESSSTAHTLVIQDLAQAQTIDGNLALTQTHVLAVQDINQAQVIDGNIVLGQTHILAIDDITQAQTIDGPINLGGVTTDDPRRRRGDKRQPPVHPSETSVYYIVHGWR